MNTLVVGTDRKHGERFHSYPLKNLDPLLTSPSGSDDLSRSFDGRPCLYIFHRTRVFHLVYIANGTASTRSAPS